VSEWQTLVDVIVPIRLEPVGMEQDTGVGTQSSQVLTIALLHNQRAPSTPIFRSLVRQALADLVKTVRLHSRNMLRGAGCVPQSKRDRERGDKVHVADVDEHLVLVVRKLGEGEIGVEVWVCLVEDGWFDEAGPWVDEELKLVVLDEPDTAASDARDGRSDRVPWSTEWYGDVLTKLLSSGGWRGRVVGCLSVCRK